MTFQGAARGGFSMVELIFALLILTLGMLAMAAGSSYATIQIRSSALRTQRTAAVAAMIEQIRGAAYTPGKFDSIPPLPKVSAKLYGQMKVWYDTGSEATASQVNPNGLRRLTIWTEGPTYKSGGRWVTSTAEGVVFDLYRPMVNRP